MACTQRRFTLEIRDDGAGFDPAAVPARGRRGSAQGLANIRRRAELLDANLKVESAPGRGTRLSLTMPVATTRRRPEAHDRFPPDRRSAGDHPYPHRR